SAAMLRSPLARSTIRAGCRCMAFTLRDAHHHAPVRFQRGAHAWAHLLADQLQRLALQNAGQHRFGFYLTEEGAATAARPAAKGDVGIWLVRTLPAVGDETVRIELVWLVPLRRIAVGEVDGVENAVARGQ